MEKKEDKNKTFRRALTGCRCAENIFAQAMCTSWAAPAQCGSARDDHMLHVIEQNRTGPFLG